MSLSPSFEWYRGMLFALTCPGWPMSYVVHILSLPILIFFNEMFNLTRRAALKLGCPEVLSGEAVG